MTARTKLVCGVALAIAAAVHLWWTITNGPEVIRAQGDTLVYRAGALAWMDGRPVYTDPLTLELQAGQMFFTYGPLALGIFAPLAALPVDLSFAVLAVLSWLALLAALIVWCRSLEWSRRDPVLIGLACTLLLGLTIPMQHHLYFGQVNAFLLLLASLDLVLRRTPWPRGMLLGLAIAIKITPAAILLLPLLRRDWRTILVAGATAAAGVLASWVIVPREASYFWFTAFRNPDRVGNLRSPNNQSIRAVFERWIDGPLGGAMWLGASLVVVALVSWIVLKVLLPRGDELGAVAVVFLLPVLLSPVAWTHHWVWSFPVVLWLVDKARQGSMGAAALAASGVLVLAFFPIDSFDPARLIPGAAEWSAIDAALAGGYVYWAMVVLLTLPFLRISETEPDGVRVEDEPAAA